MHYETQQLTENLREAHLDKGMSQSGLSKLTGIPQAQISRIEANAVDLRLSSLMAMAHALDMEVTLAPRAAMPAIRSITRQKAAQPPMQSPAIGKELHRLQDALRSLQAKAPTSSHLEALRKTYAALRPLKIGSSHLAALRGIEQSLNRPKLPKNRARL